MRVTAPCREQRLSRRAVAQLTDPRPRPLLSCPGWHEHSLGCCGWREAGRLDHPHEAGGVGLPPPWPASTVKCGNRAAGMPQREAQVNGVDKQNAAAADAAYPLERTHRVA